MKGIKSHTHQERTKLIQQLIPNLRAQYDDNFVALAADGSYARNKDTDYSDLELVLFLKAIKLSCTKNDMV